MDAGLFFTHWAEGRWFVLSALQEGSYDFGALLMYGVAAAMSIRVLNGWIVPMLTHGPRKG